LAADQITAEDEEKIDTDPAETIDATGQLESEKRSVINHNDDNGERAEQIEPWLTLAVAKSRVNRSLGLMGHQ
jgi:hypothetical protein